MVFLSVLNFVRSKGPDEFWKKRKVFKLTAQHYGRSRNCYSFAIRALHRALAYATKGRTEKKIYRRNLWMARINAACKEHGTTNQILMEYLARCNMSINNKVMSELAIYEPRTFKCLTDVAKAKEFLDNPRGLNSLKKFPEGVITRGMLK